MRTACLLLLTCGMLHAQNLDYLANCSPEEAARLQNEKVVDRTAVIENETVVERQVIEYKPMASVTTLPRTRLNFRSPSRDNTRYLPTENQRAKLTRWLQKYGYRSVHAQRHGSTTLHKAVEEGNRELVSLILHGGVPVNIRNNKGETPLHEAAARGQVSMVNHLLLESGIDIDLRDRVEETPLHKAAKMGHIDIVAILLDESPDLDARNRQGQTPLFQAASRGYRKIVQYLIDRGADVNVRDVKGINAVSNASNKGHSSIAAMLLR